MPFRSSTSHVVATGARQLLSTPERLVASKRRLLYDASPLRLYLQLMSSVSSFQSRNSNTAILLKRAKRNYCSSPLRPRSSSENWRRHSPSLATELPNMIFRRFSSEKEPPRDNDNKDEKYHTAQTNHMRPHWLQELQSPPNIITTTRILCSPLLSYWIVTGQHEMAFYGCAIAGVSDYVDGYLAKNYNMATVLGGYLDPIADKLMINALSISLWYTGVLPTPLVALWFGRDVLLLFGTAMYIRSHSKGASMMFHETPLQVNPTQMSKANTALQFITVGVGIVYPLYNIPPDVFLGLCYLTGFTTVASGFSYIGTSAFTDNGNTFEGDSSSPKKDK